MTGSQCVLRFSLSLREMFSNWFTFTVIRKYGKSGVIQITAMFDPFTMLFLEGSSEMQLFRHFSNNIFRNPQLMKCIKYEDHLFCESVQNFIYILKMQRKMEKKLFVFEIIASELAVLICLDKEKKSWDRQSICSETVRRFCLLLTENFSNPIVFTLIHKYIKGAAVKISTVFGSVYHAPFRRVLRNASF